MIRATRLRFVRPRVVALVIVTFYASTRPAYAQLDPLIGLKAQKPNILLLVDTSQSMQYDAAGTYYDPRPYPRTGAAWESTIGVDSTTTVSTYYRRFPNLTKVLPLVGPPVGAEFRADRVETVGDRQTDEFATFFERTRIEIAKRALLEMVDGSFYSARFNLLRLGQVAPAAQPEYQSASPVYPSAASQRPPNATETQAGLLNIPPAGWKITRSTNLITGNSLMSLVGPLLPADDLGGNRLVRDTVADSLGTTGALVPIGLGDLNLAAPVSLLLREVLAELARLLTGAPICQNTAIIMVVGGESIAGLLLEAVLALVSQLLAGLTGRRVPIHVVALAPPGGIEINLLRSISDISGGRFTEVSKLQIDRTVPGQPVPEAVNALNWAVQHALLPPSEFNHTTTATQLRDLTSEHQSTSPITGSVNLKGRVDIDGNLLPHTSITNAAGAEIPQRSNVMVTSGFTIPGFDGKLRAFRTYTPVVDVTRPSGYRFTQDGTRLWVASAPAAQSRNIFTVLPNGTMTTFSADNAATLEPYLGPVDAADLIERIRRQPLGAIVGSTPAIMDPPSLDPPPDADYAFFKDVNRDRRSVIFVGANDGMMHAIDGRTGIELWAFIPFNLLPKLRALPWGHGVDAGFRYMVDSSPKLSDVKVGGEWRTYLFFGQSRGGTFYNTLDVTLRRMGETIDPTNDSPNALLSHFATPSRIPWVWSFPKLTTFDPSAAPHTRFGDVAATATDIEKTVGWTWSDPAVGRIANEDGEYAVFVGSGLLPYSQQQSPNRRKLSDPETSVVAGTTFYVLRAADGEVLASRDVGSDGLAENVDDCRAPGVTEGCSRLKNALQMDPVVKGPLSSLHAVTRAYIGDLDGRVWRMLVSLGPTGAPELSTPTKLYDGAPEHPLLASMAAVLLPGLNQTRLFLGTGSDLLPSTGVNVRYKLLVLDDSGGTTATEISKVELERTDNSGNDEKVTGFPAVAGDIVFFSTTTHVTNEPCTPFNTSLYGLTVTGGPAYDTNNDGKLTTKGKNADSPLLFTSTNARGTAPFIVDQHLYMGVGNKVEVFGDPSDFNNGVGQAGVRILSWREVR